MTEEAPTAEVPAGTAGLRAGCCERFTPAPSRGEPPGLPAPPTPHRRERVSTDAWVPDFLSSVSREAFV